MINKKKNFAANANKYALLKGFTLIELMIVVAIIGILAAFAIPAYQDYIIRTRIAEGLTLATVAKSAMLDYYVTNGHFPPNEAALGWNATTFSTKYVDRIVVAPGTGRFTIMYSAALHGSSFSQAALSLTPSMNNGSISWECRAITGFLSVYPQHLPPECRP